MPTATNRPTPVDFHYLQLLRRTHPAWRLLVADHAPLIASFLHAAFIAPNIRTLSQHELISRLEDALFRLRGGYDPAQSPFPQSASSYIEAWASDDHAWLRKYYPIG